MISFMISVVPPMMDGAAVSDSVATSISPLTLVMAAVSLVSYLA